MSYFVTGTDTGVGKTLVSCALLYAFAAKGLSVAGMKPVACGCDEDELSADAKQLRAATNVLASYGQINPYDFYPPIAPHIAAKRVGVRVEFSRILTSYRELSAQADMIIVEGIGGFRVPLNEEQDSADLVQQLELPVILVVGMRLGCLNHALLTAEAIYARKLKLAGWVANVPGEEMEGLDENIAALKQRLDAPLLGVIECQAEPDARAAAVRLDIAPLMPEEEKHA